jgi:hypothetical protein
MMTKVTIIRHQEILKMIYNLHICVHVYNFTDLIFNVNDYFFTCLY